jgi:hypothetical protein
LKQKKLILLFFYHLLFIVLAYQLRVIKGISDAHFYWAQNFNIAKYSWLDFANYGTDFILFLNYPFIKMNFPFWSGFLIYGIIGFFGILKWIQWTELVFTDKIMFKGINVLYLFFFLPNLHFWTANLGKESLVFYGIAVVFYAMASHQYKSFSFIVGGLLLLIIRPHVTMMLLFAVVMVELFENKQSLKKRLLILGTSFLALLLLFYMVLQLTKIKYFNWDRIQRFNDFSIFSFRHSGSYVPMLEHNYLYRIFALNFRPIFFDAKSFLGYVASSENMTVLLVCLLGLFFTIKFYSAIHFHNWIKITFWFTLIASILYVQRYANLGIFMRTKCMFQPFMLIALFCIIKQRFILNNSKK